MSRTTFHPPPSEKPARKVSLWLDFADDGSGAVLMASRGDEESAILSISEGGVYRYDISANVLNLQDLGIAVDDEHDGLLRIDR